MTVAVRDRLLDFSLAVDAQPDVPETCIGLRDDYALDINVLLLALCAGVHRIALDAPEDSPISHPLPNRSSTLN